jgi:OOP family OmpA-OmpF porin
MKKTAKHSMMAIDGRHLGLCASLAQAQTTNSVYVIDGPRPSRMDPYGLCWRTGFWTPAAAAKDPNGCKCDKDLLPKEVCEPKAAAPAAGCCCQARRPRPARKVTVAADALFDFNKSTLRPEGKAKLDEVAAKSSQARSRSRYRRWSRRPHR